MTIEFLEQVLTRDRAALAAVEVEQERVLAELERQAAFWNGRVAEAKLRVDRTTADLVAARQQQAAPAEPTPIDDEIVAPMPPAEPPAPEDPPTAPEEPSEPPAEPPVPGEPPADE